MYLSEIDYSNPNSVFEAYQEKCEEAEAGKAENNNHKFLINCGQAQVLMELLRFLRKKEKILDKSKKI